MKLLLFLILLSSQALASTFVGNGGNAGDVELLVTLKQFKETQTFLRDEKPADLCRCSPTFQNTSLCEPIMTLSEQQVKFCKDYIIEQADFMISLIENKKIEFEWTHEKINVMEDGKLRAVDAVANTEKNLITINQERFMGMIEQDRLFLLGHELYHFAKHDGKPITDSGSISVFKGKDGGRDFLNAISAASSEQAMKHNLIRKYRGALRRSQSWKTNWIDFTIGSTKPKPKTEGAYHQDDYTTPSLSYRHYFWNKLGLILGYEEQNGSKNILSTIKGTEKLKIMKAGLTYKLFPFSNPLTQFGQSYFDLRLNYLQVAAHYTLRDSFVEITDEDKFNGASLGLHYNFPLRNGIWLSAGVTYNSYSYEYVDLNTKYNNSNTTYLGVSYGF